MSNKAVLIVDDDQDLLEMYKDIFVLEGFEMLFASSGDEAVKICQSREDIAVIISDSHMGNMSGFQLLENLRSYYKTMPVFYMLTGSFEITEEDIISKGGHALFLKPFDQDEILERIIRDTKN